ncbi:hypothetical protein PC121_g11500 [Phytophthora cactorum]|nr:hypothetical protein PC121_g11500 [Phytophthora cactorum]
MGEITESKAWHDNAAIKGSTVLKIAQREGVELPSGTILSHLQVESRADTPLEQPASAGHARKNFAAAADAILLRAVNVVKHWEAAKGTNEEL